MIDLHRFREDNKITQAEIAEVLGIKQPYISAIEKGVRPLNAKQFRLLYNRYGDILSSYKTVERPIFESEGTKKIEIPLEAFNEIVRLTDAVCSLKDLLSKQQQTINDQHQTINHLVGADQQNSTSAEYHTVEEDSRFIVSDVKKPYKK